MTKNKHILIVDDQTQILTTLELLLELEYKEITCINNPNQIPYILNQKKIDLILLDMNFSNGSVCGNEGIFWLNEIKKINKDIPVIFITAFGEIELAVKGIQNGASDFILKPFNNDKLLSIIDRVLNINKKSKSTKTPNSYTQKQLVYGLSPKMKEIEDTINKIAPTNANILIYGENGTGKQLIAEEIHRKSIRNNQTFIKVDLGALTETLIESELFGHEKGAFTNAINSYTGKIESANNGSLFLDEISNISSNGQTKLLSALQDRKITRLGSNKSIPVDIRLISATNQNIQELIANSKFRQDLYYRINTITINIPPLRERPEDIHILASHFLNIFNEKYNKNLSINQNALASLINHNWPGNIRELEHCIEKAVILNENTIQHIDIEKLSFSTQTKSLKLDEIEKQTIIEALRLNNGIISNTAKALGISRPTLYNKMNKYDL
ncbi:MAG: sigma-54-dependent transcriptional regulator [Hyphomicrobiales bacterium]